MTIEERRTELINKFHELSKRAVKEGWVVTEWHCIARLTYDWVCLDDWRKHIPKPACKHMTTNQLDRALSLCKKMETCDKYFIDLLQYASLKWRGKL